MLTRTAMHYRSLDALIEAIETASSGTHEPARPVALAADTGIERWAPGRAADIDIQVLEWLGRQMQSNRRPNTTLMTLIATLVGAAALPLAQSLPGMVDLGM